MSSITIISDTPNCGVTYDRHYDDRNSFIIQATEEMLQVVASPMIVILMTLEVSFMLQENIYSTGVPHDDCHLRLSYFYITGHSFITLSETSTNLLYFLTTKYLKNHKFGTLYFPPEFYCLPFLCCPLEVLIINMQSSLFHCVGARKLSGENLKVVRLKFTTLS
jgi:hypothetical protein